MNYQQRVNEWMQKCFGAVISLNTTERNHRFLEEALELVQSLGCTAEGAAEEELERVLQPEVIDKIRAKQKIKPAFGPLPGVCSYEADQT